MLTSTSCWNTKIDEMQLDVGILRSVTGSGVGCYKLLVFHYV